MSKISQQFKKCFSVDSFSLAWERFIRSNQRDGKDYIGISSFRKNLTQNLADLSQEVITGKFDKNITRPPKFYKPKPNGTQRTITVLPIKDALVFQAITNYVATRSFEKLNQNKDFILGSVLEEDVRLGNKLLRRKEANFFLFESWTANYKKFAEATSEQFRNTKVRYKLETDLTGFYDTIPTFNLLLSISKDYGVADDILDLLGICLGAWSGTEDGSTPGIGIPQSADSSHFFANLYLHDVDEQISAEGWAYFRYMDDICIFSYEKSDLERALCRLDQLMKTKGLSLNSNKTVIEEISEKDKEQKIFREFNYAGDEEGSGSKLFLIGSKDNNYDVVEQSGGIEFVKDGLAEETQPYDDEAILDLAKSELQVVTAEIPKIVGTLKASKEQKISKERLREITSLCFRYRMAQEVFLEKNRKVSLNKAKLRSCWLYLSEKIFWKIDHFCWILNYYQEDIVVRKKLLALYSQNKLFEWTRSQIIECLCRSQKFSVKELRQIIFPMLANEKSWFVKRFIYKLLLMQTDDKQLFKSIVAAAQKETSGPLKREILYLSNYWLRGGLTREQIIEIFGK